MIVLKECDFGVGTTIAHANVIERDDALPLQTLFLSIMTDAEPCARAALTTIGDRQSAYDAFDGAVYIASQCATV
jgi:hypothetical protein